MDTPDRDPMDNCVDKKAATSPLSARVNTFCFDYLSTRGSIPGGNEAEQLQCDYIQSGLLDSFGLLELIGEAESMFNIHFEAEDFENPAFKTVGGLIAIIRAKLP